MKVAFRLLLSLLLLGDLAKAFQTTSSSTKYSTKLRMSLSDESDVSNNNRRRHTMNLLIGGTMTLPFSASAEESIFAPKFVQQYDDFQLTEEGWSFR